MRIIDSVCFTRAVIIVKLQAVIIEIQRCHLYVPAGFCLTFYFLLHLFGNYSCLLFFSKTYRSNCIVQGKIL